MKTLPRDVRALWRRGLPLLGALGLQACYEGLDLDAPDGNSFAGPVQLGGLRPMDGSDALDAAFAAEGVFESFAFVDRGPVRVVADRMSRPIVVGSGSQPSGLLALRLTEAGALDATFGAGGVFVLPNDATGTTAVDALRPPDCVLDASDRILLFCTRLVPGGQERALLVRLEHDGSLDLGFGLGGRTLLEPSAGATATRGVSLALDPAGRILACADESGPGGRRMSVVRLDENGARDAAFGAAGLARGPEDEDSVGARLLADAAGGAVVAGSLTAEPARVALWRFDAEGVLVPGFGLGGLVTRPDPARMLDLAAVDAAQDPSGRIYLLGNRSHDLAEIDDWPTQLVDFKTSAPPVFDAIVWRFLPGGELDLAFADAGSRILAFNSGPYVDTSGGLVGGDHFDAAAGLFVDEADRVVLAGWSEQAQWDTSIGWAVFVAPTCPFLIRLTESGALDPDFNGIGHAQLGWDSITDPSPPAAPEAQGHLTAVARDAGGRWLLAGGSSPSGTSQRVWRIVP